jgi:short-subunit dehydrogenase
VNVFGLVDVTTAFLPYLREQRSGTVVLLGSRTSWASEQPVRTAAPPPSAAPLTLAR